MRDTTYDNAKGIGLILVILGGRNSNCVNP